MIPTIIGQKSCSHFVSVWTLIFRIFIFVYHENYVDDLEALFGYINIMCVAIKLLNENIFSAYSDWTISYPFPTQWQHVWAKDVVFYEDEAVTCRCKQKDTLLKTSFSIFCFAFGPFIYWLFDDSITLFWDF